jgi:hypothetical protein
LSSQKKGETQVASGRDSGSDSARGSCSTSPVGAIRRSRSYG